VVFFLRLKCDTNSSSFFTAAALRRIIKCVVHPVGSSADRRRAGGLRVGFRIDADENAVAVDADHAGAVFEHVSHADDPRSDDGRHRSLFPGPGPIRQHRRDLQLAEPFDGRFHLIGLFLRGTLGIDEFRLRFRRTVDQFADRFGGFKRVEVERRGDVEMGSGGSAGVCSSREAASVSPERGRFSSNSGSEPPEGQSTNRRTSPSTGINATFQRGVGVSGRDGAVLMSSLV
jgi:hypothetical protein